MVLFFSQGSDHLTVTWKVGDGILQHIDVREEGKENAFSLGTTLLIGNDVSIAVCVQRNRNTCLPPLEATMIMTNCC